MTEYARLSMAPTKDEHDAVVARKGRPFTDYHMREVRPVDDDSSSAALTPHERVIADSRRATA